MAKKKPSYASKRRAVQKAIKKGAAGTGTKKDKKTFRKWWEGK